MTNEQEQPIWRTVSATGHRPQHFERMPPGTIQWICEQLYEQALWLKRNRGTRVGISGMARGVDMAWAEAVLAAGLDLASYIPCPQQPDPWLERYPHDVERWKRLRLAAAYERKVADTYHVRHLHTRNDWMREDSDAILAVWIPGKTDGGTYSALRKAIAAQKPGIFIDPVNRTVRHELPADLIRSSS